MVPQPMVDGVAGHIFLLLEEAGVVVDGLLGEGFDAGPGHQRGAGLVEGDVTVAADAENLNVDAAGLLDLVLIPRAEALVSVDGAAGERGSSLRGC